MRLPICSIKKDVKPLDRLLKDGESINAITGIKHQPWDFSHKQLPGEVERGKQNRPLFDLSLRVIDTAGLSAGSMRLTEACTIDGV